MAGILKVDTLQSDSNLALKIATANVAFIDATGINVVGGNLTIGATQFAEGGQVQTAGIADGAVTNDKIASVANTKLSGLIVDSQIANVNASVISSGTLGAARLPTGSVLQVVQNTSAIATSTGSTSYVDTGLSASITPSSTSSKILVIIFHTINHYQNTNNARDFFINLVRNSTELINKFSTTGATTSSNGYYYAALDGSIVYLDSPATTSSTTYKTQMKTNSGANDTLVLINQGNSESSIILMEIAA